MSSFFSKIQSYFTKSYGGRYFEIILKEVSLEEPALMNIIFGNAIKYNSLKHDIVIEWFLAVWSG